MKKNVQIEKGNKSSKKKGEYESKKKMVKNFGRNPKCDHDWIKVQRKKGKREIKVQREKGNRSPKSRGKWNFKWKLEKVN